jgi:hypothetical protein
MSPSGETEVVLEKQKRTPRKRVPKTVSDEVGTPTAISRAPRKVAPRKRVVKKEEQEKDETEDRASKRKAPTPIAAEQASKLRARRQLMVVACMLLTGIGSSAAVGYTDKGVINVEETIAYSNEQMRASGNESGIVQVQNTQTVPNGGLIGIDQTAPGVTDPNAVNNQPPAPPAEVSTTTATTTETEVAPTESAPAPESAPTENQ